MSSVRNLNAMSVYVRPKQLKALRELKQAIEHDHDISLSMAELVRESIDNFLEGMKTPEDIETYLEYKGW